MALITYRVNAPWVWDRYYAPGETVSMTREQYEYFEATLSGLLSPVAASKSKSNTTGAPTDESPADAS